MIRKLIILSTLPALSACVSSGAVQTPVNLPTAAESPLSNVQGLEQVMGKTANQLKRLFGNPQADVAEPPARKLQFSSGACVLDAYLYPEQSGGEGRVTHIDTRRSDGAEVDRVSCVNALRVR
ncbi:hypothetical protein [Parasphingorhabdus cellanae]|uniref:Lipoprotein n=1 Tax=Parasphingorhabdus cellanae TaxID=2806553 RepID=A0ABX7T134_9SPHN|nr:hypothetical protein [Parasphingorhabdus cellanae]QTD54485.1 hypothetical protein J4G78_09275 [Parasphingorhabdus cellanae]